MCFPPPAFTIDPIFYKYLKLVSLFFLCSLQWILDKQDLLKERQKDLKFLTEEEYWKLQIFFTNGKNDVNESLIYSLCVRM